MRGRLAFLAPLLLAGLLLAGAAAGTGAWLARNPFPDGYQNEYLHVGNALDLWDALVHRDGWHLRYYLTRNYWPPLFYAAPWPALALGGATRDVLVLSNLGWLALALLAVHRLAGGGFAGSAAMLLLALCPGVYGSLVRFEPNVAQVACTALALLALGHSRGLSRPGWSAATGLVAALGLLVDRLGTLPFLALPLAAAALPRRGPAGKGVPWRGLALALGAILLVAGPWYVAWALGEGREVASQLLAGEIDAAGDLTESAARASPWRWAYYPLVLLDGQAGPVLGCALLAACLLRPRREGLLAVIGGVVLFTFVAKKQVFYTLPLLAPLCALAGAALSRAGPARVPVLLLLVAAGLHGYAGRLWGGGWPVLRALADPDPLPAAWVAPRHPIARPPTDLAVPLDAWAAAASSTRGDVVVFSEDPDAFEGFLRLCLRERLPGRTVRSIRLDPQGSWEWFGTAGAFLYVAAPPDPGWPTAARIAAALRDERWSDPPPVAEAVASDAAAWGEAGRWTLGTGARAHLWVRGP